MASRVMASCFLHVYVLLLCQALASPTDSAALGTAVRINCGGGVSDSDVYQRQWSSDNFTGSVFSVVGTTSVTEVNATDYPFIYQSARVFPAPPEGEDENPSPAYSIPCEEGSRYFVRLHFNAFPFTANGSTFDPVNVNFSVLTDSITLLKNWSPLVEPEAAVNTAVMKEFSVVCRARGVISLTFSPVIRSVSSSPQVMAARAASPSSSSAYALVNAIEVVYMPPGLYGSILNDSIAFVTVTRWNCGGVAVTPAFDKLSRTWAPDPEYTRAMTSRSGTHVSGVDVSPAFIPLDVMMTERVLGETNLMRFPVEYRITVESNATYFVRMLFAELQFKTPNARVMTLKINGEVQEENVDIIKQVGELKATWKDFLVTQMTGNEMLVQIGVSPASNAPSPQINGLEIFKLGLHDLSSADEVPLQQTPQGKRFAAPPLISSEEAGRILLKFKDSSENAALLPQWTEGSDPCKGAWPGVLCDTSSQDIVTKIDLSSNKFPNPPGLGGEIPPELGRVVTLRSIDLSNQRFNGAIPDSFGDLTILQNLSLQYNQLSGAIPQTFARLKHLQILTVEFNSLSGEVPEELLEGAELTDFRFLGGNSLCAPSTVEARNLHQLEYCDTVGSRGRSGTSTGTVVGLTVLGASLLIGFVAFFVLRRRKRNESLLNSYMDSDYTTKVPRTGGVGGYAGGLPDSERKVGQRFTLQELKKATEDFDHTRVIGTGGFGNVYKGELEDGDVVAIKRGSPESRQGLCEFQTEIITLSKLRHRHLVSLVGYCDEEGEMILVYEYMALGTLRGHLYGKTCGTDFAPLSWRKRLEICIGAARGLDYLHSGAQEMVIHRDVKSTNILLDEKYVAKVADFGLSKSGPSLEETHVSTAVKGSFGYLDPAYFKSQQLTEKSDVYSFGVVLLEVITARAPISQNLPKDQINLADFAMPYLVAGKVEQIVDPKLVNTYGTASLYKVAEVALCCLGEDRDSRPSMTDVRRGLEDALMLQDTSLSVVLDTPPAPMMCVNYDSEYHDYTNATGTSDPPSPPESLVMAR